MLSQDLRTEHFRQSMRRVASTVSVITCTHDGRRHGITVTSVTALSFAPMSILACINRKSSISMPLKEEGRYCINVLRASQADISNSFSGGCPTERRFDIGEWTEKEGVPYLRSAQANLFCEMDQAISYATHDIIIGRVAGVAFAADVDPLIYQNGAYALTSPMVLQKAG
ncbi:flavin reductase family protein [Labrys wisconsinensis]|uniref:Flavin reductase (DIM6/NTAB) family NADH-FMN oxidoreductase RutF n=1 Tax=Labrys wisconsinensis TaxID=425677 RepID=A0ABU0J894_9HYPH|nr:flavin reductase family protein [Labrys wisconsinensis]MDQ0469648.1 flavin reductase (DIM6/NTAB) family NADH-FMN oxidoreductase RutF [Labrys wisconsinensis]